MKYGIPFWAVVAMVGAFIGFLAYQAVAAGCPWFLAVPGGLFIWWMGAMLVEMAVV